MKKLIPILLLVSVVFIAGCTQQEVPPESTDDQGQQNQPPVSDMLTDEEKDTIRNSLDDMGYTNITSLQSDPSMSLIIVEVKTQYTESDVTKVFEMLRRYSKTSSYQVMFIINKGSTTTTDDIRCTFTATPAQVDQMISSKWNDWKDNIAEATC